MKSIHFITYLFLIGIMFTSNQKANAQAVTDRVEFTVRTSSPNGNYSPKNIGAIWIENSNGDFIKTLKLWANRRKQYLYTWDNVSNQNTVDAITGATISSHQTHSAIWNVTDVNGDRVPDGTYSVVVEMTDEHSQGPMASFDFPVGQQTDSLSFSDETYFHDLKLKWFSNPVGIGDDGFNQPSAFELFQNYPNPFNPATTIRFSLSSAGFVNLKIFNLRGEEIIAPVSDYLPVGDYKYRWNANGLASGVYIVRIEAGGSLQTRKMVLLK